MPTAYEKRILRVLDYIYDNPAGDLSLDQLADIAAMSRFHWHRVFRAVTGETCAQATRRMRLHRAADALVRSDRSVEQIARSVGYSKPGSFSRAFTEAYGSTPAAYRVAGRKRPPFPAFKTGVYPMYPVITRVDLARRLVGLPHKGSYHQIGKAFETYAAIAQSRNLWPQLGASFGVYFDNPDVVPDEDLRSFAGGEYRGDQVPDGMDEVALSGGKTAVLTYKGPYSGITAAYHTLFGDWLPKSGEEPADTPCYEIYLNNPREVAPEDLLTEICLPLK